MDTTRVPRWYSARLVSVTKWDRAGFWIASLLVPYLLTKGFFPISSLVPWLLQLGIIAAYVICVASVWRAVYLASGLAEREDSLDSLLRVSNELVEEIERLRVTYEAGSPRKYFINPSEELTAHLSRMNGSRA